MEIKIVNRSKHPLPEYKTKASAGMDIRANLEEIVTLKPLERKLIPTGLLNSPGTLDADYRGELGVIVVNLSNNMITIEDGERICQMVINKVEQAEWIEVNELSDSERGDGGFGHTGKK